MGTLEASHTVEIAAPIDEVYAVAADVSAAVEWQPSVQAVEVLERHPDGSVRLVELEADAVVKKSVSVLRYEYSPPGTISWEQEEGDAKSLTGEWEFSAVDEGTTKATYALRADPGRMLGMLLRGPVEDKVKDFLTRGAAEGLKEHCERR
jgi:uncharacterized membrane protein